MLSAMHRSAAPPPTRESNATRSRPLALTCIAVVGHDRTMQQQRNNSDGRALRRSNAWLRMRVGIHYILMGLLVIIGGWIVHADIARLIGDGANIVTILQVIRDQRAVTASLGIVPLFCGTMLVVSSRFRWLWHLVALVWAMMLIGILLAFVAMKLSGYYTTG